MTDRVQQLQAYALEHIAKDEEVAARDALKLKQFVRQALDKATTRAQANFALAIKLEAVLTAKQTTLIQLIREAKHLHQHQEAEYEQQQQQWQQVFQSIGLAGDPIPPPFPPPAGAATTSHASPPAAVHSGYTIHQESAAVSWSSPSLHTTSSMDGYEGSSTNTDHGSTTSNTGTGSSTNTGDVSSSSSSSRSDSKGSSSHSSAGLQDAGSISSSESGSTVVDDGQDAAAVAPSIPSSNSDDMAQHKKVSTASNSKLEPVHHVGHVAAGTVLPTTANDDSNRSEISSTKQ
eukprot:jgi/Chrzof1/12888/Cz07g11050.t1